MSNGIKRCFIMISILLRQTLVAHETTATLAKNPVSNPGFPICIRIKKKP